jgi:hypothetical protein
MNASVGYRGVPANPFEPILFLVIDVDVLLVL